MGSPSHFMHTMAERGEVEVGFSGAMSAARGAPEAVGSATTPWTWHLSTQTAAPKVLGVLGELLMTLQRAI